MTLRVIDIDIGSDISRGFRVAGRLPFGGNQAITRFSRQGLRPILARSKDTLSSPNRCGDTGSTAQQFA
jgi:hypothetical protein